MLLTWFIVVGLLAMEGAFSYRGQSFDECPTFDDQGSLPQVNDVSQKPRFEMTMRDIKNGYITNGTYDLRIKANNPFHSFSKFIVAFENLDKTCENVALVPLFGNIRYLNDCKGVMASDRPVNTTKLLFEWRAPYCGCVKFKAKVYEGSIEQPTTLTPIKVCPNLEDLDEYLNDLLEEVSPEVAEDDLDVFAISSEEEEEKEEDEEEEDEEEEDEEVEYSSEEFDGNIVDYPNRDSAVRNPKGLCREFTISRGSGIGSRSRRRWRRCCKKTGADVRACIVKTIPPAERINLQMRSVCRAIDLIPVTSASFNFRRCCNPQTASKMAHCFQRVKFQNIDDYCEGHVRNPLSFRGSESLLSSEELSPCCSMTGRHRYSCFNKLFGDSRKNNKRELSRQNAAEGFCARVEEKGDTSSGLKYCCNKLNVHDKITCIGKLVRDGYDAKCDGSKENNDLFKVVRSKSLEEVWRRIENSTHWRVTNRRCCLKDKGEERYRCLAQKHKNIRTILYLTRSSNTPDSDLTSVSGEVSEDLVPEEYSGDLAPEVYSGDLTPEKYSGELEPELFGYSPTHRIIDQDKDGRSCHNKTVRRIRHKLRVLNRICNKPQSRSGDRHTSNYMRRCCVKKPAQRLACLQFEEEERFSDICRGEITPFALRLGLDHNNPCCQKVYRERSCCFEDHLSSQQLNLGRRPPMLVDLLRLKSDPRGMRELNRMDMLCQDVAEKSKAEMWGRHNVFKCCQNDGRLKYLCLLQVFRTYTDKACSGKKIAITYEIGKFGEIPHSLPEDFLSPNHTCCQFEDRESYDCVLNRGFDRADEINVSGSVEREQVGEELEGEVGSDAQQRICEGVKSYESEGFFEVIEFVQGVVRSIVDQHDKIDEGEEFDEDLDDEYDAPVEKDRHGGDEVTKGRSFEDEDEHLEQDKKGGPIKSRRQHQSKTSDRSEGSLEFQNEGAGSQSPHRGRGQKRSHNKGAPPKVRTRGQNQTVTHLHRDEDEELGMSRRRQNKGTSKHEDTRRGMTKQGNQTVTHLPRDEELGMSRRRQNNGMGKHENTRRGMTQQKKGNQTMSHLPRDGDHGTRRGPQTKGRDPRESDSREDTREGMTQQGNQTQTHLHREHGVQNKTHWHGKHPAPNPHFESASVALKKVSFCCKHTGRKFGSCLKEVHMAMLRSVCTLDLDLHNFTSNETSKLGSCCPLKGRRRIECFVGEADGSFEEVADENLLVPGDAAPDNTFEDERGDEDFDESESSGRMKRNAGWWTSGLSVARASNAGEWLSGQYSGHRSRGMDGKLRLLDLLNDRHVGRLCTRIVDEGAVGAFGDYREASDENTDRFEGLDGKPRDHVSDGDYVSIIESLRECCVIGDNRKLTRCVRRIRRIAVDQRCAEVIMHGRSVLRRNVPFSNSCCDVTGRERYSCVSQLGHRKKDVTDAKDEISASSEHRDPVRESSSNSGPTHNFIL